MSPLVVTPLWEVPGSGQEETGCPPLRHLSAASCYLGCPRLLLSGFLAPFPKLHPHSEVSNLGLRPEKQLLQEQLCRALGSKRAPQTWEKARGGLTQASAPGTGFRKPSSLL